MITFNANITAEAANTALAAATDEGVFLVLNASGLMALPAAGAGHLDAIMMSEIVTDAEWRNRQYIYTDIDYSGFTRIGEPISVVKGFHGLTAHSIAMTAGAAMAAGTEVQVDANGKLVVLGSGTAIGRLIDATTLNQTKSGAVQLY